MLLKGNIGSFQLYAVDNQLLFKALDKIDNNNSKNEYYLTDIVKSMLKFF